MLLQIQEVLNAAQVTHCRAELDTALWVHGNATAGPQSGRVKDNLQLSEDAPIS